MKIKNLKLNLQMKAKKKLWTKNLLIQDKLTRLIRIKLKNKKMIKIKFLKVKF